MKSLPATTAFKRLPRADRREELLAEAERLALSEGLTKITARRVAAGVGVAQGLVTHYFGSVDELLAAAFERFAERERAALGGVDPAEPLAHMRHLLSAYVSNDRDAAALLWLDAWRESATRPAVRAAVVRQMERDVSDFNAIISRGIATGVFPAASSKTAMRILALIDALSANAAVRTGIAESTLDYENVADFVLSTAERELGLADGALHSSAM